MAIILIIVFVLFSTTGLSQHIHGTSEPRIKATKLFPGIGAQPHPVSTRSREAQQFFNQGLAFVYAFNHDQAAASFERAAELDPELAMAHWGIALANGPNYNMPEIDSHAMEISYAAIQKAMSLSAKASEREKAYIRALARRFSSDPQADNKVLGKEYSNAMRALFRSYPDDADAAVLYVESMMDLRPWRLWTANGQPAEGTEEIVQVLESVLKRQPRHVGANHFYIHALEASPFPERALPSANRIAELAPNAGHLVHMPAHIFMRTGDYHAAAITNEKAAEVDRKYIQEAGDGGMYPLMYYNHNLHFLAIAHMMQGRFADAMKAAEEASARSMRHAAEFSMLQSIVALPYLVSARFQRWDDLLATEKPPGNLPIRVAFWRFARGIAQAAKGMIQQSDEDLRLVALFVTAAPSESMIGLNKTTTILKMNEHVLAGKIATAKKDHKTASEHFKKAVALQDELHYDEPPGYFYPVRESLGAALLRSGDAGGAEAVFREDLRQNPRNPRSLYGLAEALRVQKKLEEAKKVEADFKEAWKHADSELSLDQL